MRLLFTCTPGVGHFHPLVPIARAGIQAGHEVAFATPASFVPTVERSGFRAFPAGMAALPAERFPELRGLRGRAATECVWLRVRPAQALTMVTDLLGIIDTWRPDLLVRERGEYGGCIAAERRGLPYASVEINAAQMGQDQRAMLSAGLAPVLAECGLPPDPALQIQERQLVLSPFPPSYRGSAPEGAASPRLAIRPTPFDQSGDEGLPTWIGSLLAQATVYLTLGTSSLINTRPSVMRAFIDGFANEPLNLIITVGRNNAPADLGPAPSNVWIERYIPQTLLFPHCALVICHAGSGTVMAALVHGLPLVLVPIAADQPQNARRCDALGLATVLDVDRLDPTITRAAVRNVLADPSYRQHAETVRAEIEALPGPEQAVIYLERLAARQDLGLCHP